MNYLLIDTSNQPLSVAIMQDDKVLSEFNTNEKKNHSVQLMPAIANILEESQLDKKELDAIIVAEGPGSYTGLRIGVTVAKTLAYALNTKLYGVSSLKALAATVKEENILIVPVFDARREAVYSGVYQYQNGHLVQLIEDHDCIPNLPKAKEMKALIDHPTEIHQFKPNYIKISEAERNWLDQQNKN